jgi:carbon starvation protein CstA
MTLVVTVVRRVGGWERRVTYRVVHPAPPAANLLYIALVNYTTLGDVLPVARWSLLGPITAMTGILLFGWSTVVIFEVLDRAMQMRDSSGKTRG